MRILDLPRALISVLRKAPVAEPPPRDDPRSAPSEIPFGGLARGLGAQPLYFKIFFGAHQLYLSHEFAPAAVRKVRNEATRESWKLREKFAEKCLICGVEYDSFTEECETEGCEGELRKPDPKQIQGLKALLDHPDPWVPGMSLNRILARTVEYQQELCNWYWRLIPDEKGLPAAIEPLPSEFMEAYAGPKLAFCPRCYKSGTSGDADQLQPEAYLGTSCPKCGGVYEEVAFTKYNVSAIPIGRFARDEVIHGKINLYGDGLHGYPNVVLVQWCIRTLAWMDIFQSDAYGLQEYPESIIPVVGISQDSLDQMLESVRLKKLERKSKKTHLVLGIPQGGEVQQPVRMMPSLVELDAVEFKKAAREEIAINWGVSLTSMGLPVPGKLGNETELMEVSVNTVEAAQSEIEETLNRELLPRFGVTDWVFEMLSPRKDDIASRNSLKMQAINLHQRYQAAGFEAKLSADGTECEPGDFVGKPEPEFPAFGQPPPPGKKPAYLQPDGGRDT